MSGEDAKERTNTVPEILNCARAGSNDDIFAYESANIILVPQTLSIPEKAGFDLQNYITSMSMSFTSKITRCTSSFVTCLTFVFFRIGFDGALRFFPAVNTAAEVDTLEVTIPLLKPSSTVAVAEASLHNSCSDTL